MSSARSDATIRVGDRLVPVRVMPMRQARRYRLSVDGAHGLVRLTMPLRASLPRALAWAGGQGEWIAAQLARVPAATPLADGVAVPVEGAMLTIVRTPGARTVAIDGDRLLVGGPAESVGPRVVRWLKARARAVLEAETRELAGRHGLAVATVGIGDPRRRWGSCTSGGAIRYSWRLICAPAAVRRATVAHEVAHLRHLDHSPAFHAFHAELLGGETGSARRWLGAHGPALHLIG